MVKSHSYEEVQIIWSVFVILVTAAVVYLVQSHLNSYLANDNQVKLARKAQWKLHELAIELQSVENGARGYLLSPQERFLDNYLNARRTMDATLKAADNAVPGVQLQDEYLPIRALAVKRLADIDRIMELAQAGKTSEAKDILLSDDVLKNGHTLRDDGTLLLKRTDNLLRERLDICRNSTRSMTAWVSIGVAALSISSTALVVLLWRDLRRQRRIATEMMVARDDAVAGTRARDEFLNVLSHELRTPLTPALACIGLLERKTPKGTELHEDLTMIRRQLELEARLIDDLLNVEQTLRGKMVLRPRDVSMHELVKQAIESCQEQIVHNNLTLARKLEATRDIVRGDESRLYLVMWHLMSNAVKFTPAGGSVSVQSANSDGSIVVTVADTGIGMTGQQLATIFQPFRQVDSSLTRRFGGLGLGLVISKHVAELHGGSIRAASGGMGKGASFTLTLPVVESEAPQGLIQRRAEPLSELR